MAEPGGDARIATALARIETVPRFTVHSRVMRITGPVIEASPAHVAIGEVCRIETVTGGSVDAEVVGFHERGILLMPLGELEGIHPGAIVQPLGRMIDIGVGDGLIGRVLDGLGRPLDGLGSLGPTDRRAITAALAGALSDGLDLHSQLKVAHWNVKGPHFAALHPLLDGFATALAGFNDEVAERAVTLGARIGGTVRQVAGASRLTELPADMVRDLELVALLADRIEGYLSGLRAARAVAEERDDQDTVDLLTGMVEQFEKNGWFLRATLE
jgi:starvation-inducible DNA-binding protein